MRLLCIEDGHHFIQQEKSKQVSEEMLSFFNKLRTRDHGYHVVAPDLRGYADSDSPPSHESYTVSHLVADVIGLLDHYGTAQAFVSGHDWGATIGWSLCLFRPDRVKGFISLSAPYFPRHPNLKPLEFFKSFGDGLYISQVKL
ncbi:hypothetical protein YC2023_101932 [Brassica napus]